MSKETLVVFWSYTGNTKKIALETAQILDADIEELVDKTKWSGFSGELKRSVKAAVKGDSSKLEPTKLNPQNYKKIIVLSPFWGPTVTPTIRTYLKNNRDKIDSFWLIVTYGYSGLEKCKKEIQEMGFTLNGILGIKTGVGANASETLNAGDYKIKLNDFLQKIM